MKTEYKLMLIGPLAIILLDIVATLLGREVWGLGRPVPARIHFDLFSGHLSGRKILAP